MAKNKDTPDRPTARRTWAQSAIAERIRALGAAGHQHVKARRDAGPPRHEETGRATGARDATRTREKRWL